MWSLAAASGRAQGGATAALEWLRSTQGADGRWAGERRLAIRDTAEAVAAFDLVAPEDPALLGAVDALAAEQSGTLDLEARRLRALRGHVPALLLELPLGVLASHQLPDGGWAIHERYEQSDALDTAVAARALSASGVLAPVPARRVLDRLEQLQNGDGGFGQAEAEPSDVVTTSEALRALGELALVLDVEPVRSRAVAYVVSMQGADGGFAAMAGASSDATTTALAVLALRGVGSEPEAAYPAARAFLLAEQGADGSWFGDPYTTALAAQVLAGEVPRFEVEPASLDFGLVAVGQSVSAPVTVRNAGTVALTVTVTVTGAYAVDPTQLSPIPPGGSAELEVTFSPTVVGLAAGALTLETNDPARPTVVVSLVGDARADDDADGVPESIDNCPTESNADQLDDDGDGIGNVCDGCLATFDPDQADGDGDGHGNVCDNCVGAPNPLQGDQDSDGVGDACDNCIGALNADQTDTDGDGIGSACDNCPRDSNAAQADADNDGLGDVCDFCNGTTSLISGDDDGDGALNGCDNCRFTSNTNQADGDGDFAGDACDNCPDTANREQAETDVVDAVAAWRFEEQSGTVALDAVHDHDGMLVNGAARSAGRFGRALLLDGVDDYAEVPDAPQLRVQRFTLEARIRADRLGVGQEIISKRSLCATTQSDFPYALAITVSGRLELVRGTGADFLSHGVASAGAVIVVGREHHVAASYDGTTNRLYVDGVQVASSVDTTPTSQNTRPLRIGRTSFTPSGGCGTPNYFQGQIDEVAIHDRALSAGEIADHAARGLGDGFGDSCDTCVTAFDPDQADGDDDGRGDACDLCPVSFEEELSDADLDGRGDSCDSCPLVANSAQTDSDEDGLGDACDNCVDVANVDQAGDREPDKDIAHLWSFEEASGVTAVDDVDNRDGTLSGGVTRVPARWGNGLSFDGVNDLVQFPAAVGNVGTADFTISWWMRTQPALQAVLGRRPICGLPVPFEVRMLSDGRLEFGHASSLANDGTVYSVTRLSAGVWYHVAVQREGLTSRLFVNGNVDVTRNVLSPINVTSTTPFRLGFSPCVGVDGTLRYRGDLDEVAFYDRALSSAELARQAQLGPRGDGYGEACDVCSDAVDPGQLDTDGDGVGNTCDTCPTEADPEQVDDEHDSGLMSLWRFEEDSGSAILDAVGPNNGTLTRATRLRGRFGQGLHFEEGDVPFAIAPGTGFNALQRFTFQTWVRLDRIATNSHMRYVTLGNEKACLRTSFGALQFFLQVGGTFQVLSVSNVLQIDRWMHVAGTYDGATMTLYLDGNVVGTRAAAGTVQQGSGMYLSHTSSEALDGALDEVAVFDRALTAEEIRRHRDRSSIGDGFGAACDNCATFDNPGQEDVDTDDVGDVCDNCPNFAAASTLDSDADELGDACDNCPLVPNPEQRDVDVIENDPAMLSGAISYWRMDEGFGTTAGDSVGTNPGALQTPINWTTTSRADLGLFVNQGRIVVPNAPSLSPTQRVTMSLWVKPRPPTAFETYYALMHKGSALDCTVGCENRQYALFMHRDGWIQLSSTSANRVGVGESSCTTSGTGPGLVMDAWNHVVGVVDSPAGRMQVFINGELRRQCSYSTSGIRTGSQPLYIGANGNTLTYRGEVDEAALWSRALSTDEVRTVYERGAANLHVDEAWQADGLGDACDNCASAFNTDQEDADADGLGDACDTCPSVANPGQEDDQDGDGVADACDVCPLLANPGQDPADCVCDEAVAVGTYTVDADFDEGTFINVNHDVVHDQLQLNETVRPFNRIWVACSNRGTVVQIDTDTGEVRGEYLSSPHLRGRSPSRVTVDLMGNAWAGNRVEAGPRFLGDSIGGGSVVKFGQRDTFQCADRNRNGVIETSTGLGDVRPWSNLNQVDTFGGVESAEDECILVYARTSSHDTRAVAVDANNDVWVGGDFDGQRTHAYDRLDGRTGAIQRTIDLSRPQDTGEIAPLTFGGYGALVDSDGVLWGAAPGRRVVARIDPSLPNGHPDLVTVIPTPGNAYGLGIDSNGFVWNGHFDANTVSKIAPDGTIVGTFPTGDAHGDRGIAVTPDDDVWVANSLGYTVSRLGNDGSFRAVVDLRPPPAGYTGNAQPTGLAADAAGKVWVTNLDWDDVRRIDPATNEVDLVVNLQHPGQVPSSPDRCGPYNYSDMTGAVALGATANGGFWTVTLDGEQTGSIWGRVDWNSDEPGGSRIEVEVRAADTQAALGTAVFRRVVSGATFCDLTGRFLQINVRFVEGEGEVSPVLFDLSAARIARPPEPPPDISLGLTVARDIYGANETVEFVSTLTNLAGAGRHGVLRIDILDAGGLPVGTALDVPISFLGSGDQIFTPTFFTSLLVPGTYAAQAVYLEDNRELVALATFTVAPDRELLVDITTDRVSYGPNEDVIVTSTVENGGLNASFVELMLRVEIPGPGGGLVFEQTFPAFDLGPGAIEKRLSVFPTGSYPPGEYVAELIVVQDGATLGGDQTTFHIVPSTEGGFGLVGSLDCSPSPVEEGDPATVTGALVNTGNFSFAGLRLELTLLDTATFDPVRSASDTLDLPIGASASPAFEIDTTGVRRGTYVALLEVSRPDAAPFFTLFDSCDVIDLTPPKITIEAPICTAADVTPVVSITETNDYTATYVLDREPYDGGTVTSEGDHVLDVIVVDDSGNEGIAVAAFVIDRTAPNVMVEGVFDGQVAGEPVTPVVTFDDENFTSSTLLLDGEPFVSGTTIDEDGVYVIEASAIDCAGNEIEVVVSFEIRQVAGSLVQVLASGSSGTPRVLVALDCIGGAGPSCTLGEPELLRAALDSAGILHDEAVRHDEWRVKLRSGRYDTYILYRPHASETAPYAELNEAVWLCEGLVAIKPHPDAAPRLREAIGLSIGGAVPGGIESVTLADSLGVGVLPASGEASWLQLSGATEVATTTAGSRTRTVGARHAVGRGRALTLGWDTETSESAPFYLDAVEVVAPSTACALLPGGFADVRVTVTNTGIRETSYTVRHELDPPLTTADPIVHELTLGPAEAGSFALLVALPDDSGLFGVSATLEAEGKLLDTDTLGLLVERTAGDITADVLADLDALALGVGEGKKRDQAIAYVSSAAMRVDPEQAISDILAAIARVRDITSVDVTDIRVDLARLLRVYQTRWTP